MTDIRDFEAYAREVIAAKGQDSKDLQLLESTKRVIRQAFSTTYHAVALDIDGTITEAGDRRIPEDLAISLSEKLNNGIYLILVTGGGVSTVEDTVEQFLQYNKERRKWRIYAIIGEGCRLLTIDAYGKVNDQSISPPLKSLLKESYPDFLNTLKSEFETEFEIQEKECTIRMLSKGNSTEQELKAKIQAWYTTASEDVKVANIRPVAGRYGGKLTFDIAASDKDVGLLRFYTDYDFADIPILRIGDQGGEEGNDWSLLDSAYGFSVGTLSNQPCKSFPIFNEDQNHRRLLGVEGTRYLLDKVKWSRRLILPSSLVKDSSFDYWEALRLIGLDAENKIKYAISKWTEDAKGFFDKETLDETVSKRFGNIFDNESGAVWLTEIEWYKVNTHPLYSFFTTRKESATCNECPNLERALYLDYGIILRGSKYYWGLANETNEYLASKIADETLDLHRLLLNLEIKLDPKEPFLDWKLKLAVLDNFRNNCLILYSMIFDAASITTNSKAAWKRLLLGFQNYVSAVVTIYYAWFLLDFEQIQVSLIDLRNSASEFYKLRQEIRLLYRFLLKNKGEEDKIIRKWRETDHPGEIVASIYSVLESSYSSFKEKGKLSVIGLMYGGVELPFVFRYLFKKVYNLEVSSAHLGGISFYQKYKGSTLMEQYADTLLESALADAETVDDVLSTGGSVIILDDNIMTGRTIELAKDRMISYGCEVPFSVCVRYPPEHRTKQMEMKNHGGIDPQSLRSEIKGLVSMSPYTRIFSTSDYRDFFGQFDLSRERIENYISKNFGLKRK